MPLTCPACSTELDPASTQCPICLRPRSRSELIQGLKRKQRRWLPWAVFCFVAAAASIVWFRKSAPRSNAPVVEAPKLAVEGPTVVVLKTPEPPPSPAPTAPPAAAWPKPGAWNFEGTVIDLDGKAVNGGSLVFRGEITELEYPAPIRDGGRFQVSLPRVEHKGYGYRVTATVKGYRPDPVKDFQRLLTMAEDDRKAAAVASEGPLTLVMPRGANAHFETLMLVPE